MDFISIFKLYSIRVSFVPFNNYDSFFPSIWTCCYFALDFIPYIKSESVRNAIFKSIYQKFPVYIFSYKTKVGLPLLSFLPSIFEKSSGKKHMNPLKNIGLIHANNIDDTFIPVKISRFRLNKLANPILEFSKTYWLLNYASTRAYALIMDVLLINI